MLIHCRIGTSGVKTEYNTHPFMVNENVCLIHNGILDINVPKDSKKNDTQIFIDKYLSKINSKMLLHSDQLHKLIAEVIGKSNKFVLMDNKGYYKIINEKSGHWKNNVWYSNSSYEERTYLYRPYSSWDYDDYGYDSWEYINGKWVNVDEHKGGSVNEVTDPYRFYDIENAIFSLKEEELLEIGDAPVYCQETGEIISLDAYSTEENGYLDLSCDYLIDLSEHLYEEYMEIYDEVKEQYYSQEGMSVV